MLYDYRHVMSVRCPSFTDNCDPTYVLYTTGVLMDSPLFTRGGASGNSPLHPAGLKFWDTRTLIAYPLIPMHHSSFDYDFMTTHFDLSNIPNIKVAL
jgi:hypothetical protein